MNFPGIASPAARRASAAALIALTLVASGCSSGQRRARYVAPEQRAQRAPIDHAAFASLGYRLQWRGFSDNTTNAPVEFFDVFGDTVVLQNEDAYVTVLEADSGERRWSDQVDNALTKFVGNVRDGDRLIISSESDIYFYDIRTSSITDKQRIERVVNTRPVQVGPILVYGCSDGQVLGHLILNGYKLWGNSISGAIVADPLMIGDVIGAVSQTGQVIFVDPSSGTSTGRSASAFAGTSTSLAASDGLLFLASLDHSLYAFDPAGRQVWRIRTSEPIRATPVYIDGRLYCSLPGHGLAAVDAYSGRILWENVAVVGDVVGVRSGRLVVWDGADAAWTLDPADGTVVDSARLTAVARMSMVPMNDGDLYIASPGGVVSKFIPRN